MPSNINARRKVFGGERDLILRIMGTSPVGIVVADRTGRITFANHCAETALGLTKEAVEQRICSVLDWSVADDEGLPLAGQPRPLQQLLAHGRPVLDVCHTMELRGGTPPRALHQCHPAL
jgi:PAS domain-containing protein